MFPFFYIPQFKIYCAKDLMIIFNNCNLVYSEKGRDQRIIPEEFL